jgi:hypothetical protein
MCLIFVVVLINLAGICAIILDPNDGDVAEHILLKKATSWLAFRCLLD